MPEFLMFFFEIFFSFYVYNHISWTIIILVSSWDISDVRMKGQFGQKIKIVGSYLVLILSNQ